MKLFSRVMDTTLNRLIGVTEAGACVPNNGYRCYCKRYNGRCRAWDVSCSGPCQPTGPLCNPSRC